MPKRLAPFQYFGGKVNQLKTILPALNVPCEHFIEPFCGSAVVTINRTPAPLETVNDMNGEIINFFRQLRDNNEELLNLIYLTPASREEFRNSVNTEGDSDVERARKLFISLFQTFTGSPADAAQDNWAGRKISPTRANSLTAATDAKLRVLPTIARRLRMVQFECMDALKLIKKYDQEGVLFYCDPPYLAETRATKNAYKQEMNQKDQHKEFIDVVRGCSGKVMISGYASNLYKERLHDWHRIEYKVNVSTANTVKRRTAVECIWMNYTPRQRGAFF